VLEAIANKDFVRVGFLLIHAHTDLLNGKSLFTIRGEIHNGARLRLTKQIFNLLHFAQAHRQKGFDSLPLYELAFLTTDWACVDGVGQGSKILGEQLTHCVSCCGRATTSVSH
jgi:hypothetical protein